jgi:hypothetical protein
MLPTAPREMKNPCNPWLFFRAALSFLEDVHAAVSTTGNEKVYTIRVLRGCFSGQFKAFWKAFPLTH